MAFSVLFLCLFSNHCKLFVVIKDNGHKNWIYSYRVGSIRAELYKCAMENMLSNTFLSDLFKLLRNTFHSFSSIMLAIRNEGIVLPIVKDLLVDERYV